jgi:hypothetical protein
MAHMSCRNKAERSPHFLKNAENRTEKLLFSKESTEPHHKATLLFCLHVRERAIIIGPLKEQRMCAVFDGVRTQQTIESQTFTGSAEHGQQRHGKRA